MLELYANMLCHKNEVANIKKFARTVTNKVINVPIKFQFLLTLASGFYIFSLMTKQR